MKNLQKIFQEKFAKEALKTAEKEADLACFCLGYQPGMREKEQRGIMRLRVWRLRDLLENGPKKR